MATSRLKIELSGITDFTIREKLRAIVRQLNKLDLGPGQDRIQNLDQILFDDMAANPDEEGEIQRNGNTVTSWKTYIASAVYTFMLLEHWITLQGVMSVVIYPDPEGSVTWPTFRAQLPALAGQKLYLPAFPASADAGWCAVCEIAGVPPDMNLGIKVKFAASNSTGASKAAIFVAAGRVVNTGENTLTGGTTFSQAVTATVPDGDTEYVMRSADVALVANASLSDADFVIFEGFYRDVSDAGDTLASDILVLGFEPFWTDQAIPGAP